MTVATPRVLVVSESRITRRVAEATFADQDVELVLASNGQQGLEMWAAQPASVVVVDLTMEPPDGLTVARQVGASAVPPAVIALAGQNDAVDEDAVADAGVRALLRKPLDSKQLMEAVHTALRTPAPAAHPARAEAQAEVPTAPWTPAPVEPEVVDDAFLPPSVPPAEALERWGALAPAPAPAEPAAAAGALTDDDLERIAARVMALWSSSFGGGAPVADKLTERAERVAADSASAVVEKVAPQAAAAAAERLVRELAPKLVEQVARMVVTDVSERLVREEIARMRSAHAAR